jgi:hypothetical protein
MLGGGERESGRATARSLSGGFHLTPVNVFDSDEYFPALRTSDASKAQHRVEQNRRPALRFGNRRGLERSRSLRGPSSATVAHPLRLVI